MKISAPKGTRDVLPEQSHRWLWLEEQLRRAAGRYGFAEIRFPVFEHTELFLRGIGDTTDVVQKEMYTFQDKGDRSVTLRPEGTASTVRAFVEHGLHTSPMPCKCYYIAPNFRYENPQKGRLRQHHQFGVECFGAGEPSADAEVIALGADITQALGLREVDLRINSLGCPGCRPGYKEKLTGYLDGCRESLCPDCRQRLDRNPLRVLDCKNTACRAIAQEAPKGLDCLCPDCAGHMDAVRGYLDAMNLPFTLDPFMVRGLDYYTKTVFEFVSGGLTILGGGRYDGLVEALGGPATPGLGFGCGLERLLSALEEQGVPCGDPPRCDLYIAALGPEADRCAMGLCRQLRGRGLAVERDLCGRGLKAQMKYADKRRARYTLVLGDQELAQGQIALKNMDTGQSQAVALDPARIAERMEG